MRATFRKFVFPVHSKRTTTRVKTPKRKVPRGSRVGLILEHVLYYDSPVLFQSLQFLFSISHTSAHPL